MKLTLSLTLLFFISCTPTNKKQEKLTVDQSSKISELSSELLITKIKMNSLKSEIDKNSLEIRALNSQVKILQDKFNEDNPESGDSITSNQVNFKQKSCFNKMRESVSTCEPVNCLTPTESYQSKKMFRKNNEACSIETKYNNKQKDECTFPIAESGTAKILIESILAQDADLILQNKIDAFIKKYCKLAKIND